MEEGGGHRVERMWRREEEGGEEGGGKGEEGGGRREEGGREWRGRKRGGNSFFRSSQIASYTSISTFQPRKQTPWHLQGIYRLGAD